MGIYPPWLLLPPPRNKALIRTYWGMMLINTPLIRPYIYFFGGGGALLPLVPFKPPALRKTVGGSFNQSFFQHRHLKGGVTHNKKHIFQIHHLDFLLKKNKWCSKQNWWTNVKREVMQVTTSHLLLGRIFRKCWNTGFVFNTPGFFGTEPIIFGGSRFPKQKQIFNVQISIDIYPRP